MNNIRQPAEPKPELVECAIIELLDIAERQGITPADFIQLLDSGLQISDFLAAMNPVENGNRHRRLRFLVHDPQPDSPCSTAARTSSAQRGITNDAFNGCRKSWTN